eukprot:6469244-Amphidinium_carterae.1
MGQPDLHQLIRYHRLNFLRRVLVADNRLVRACSAVFCRGSLWNLWLADLKHVHEHGVLPSLPTPSPQCIPIWCQSVILLEGKWKSELKRVLLPLTRPSPCAVRRLATGKDTLIVVEAVAEHPDAHIEQQPPQDLPFKCPECDRCFATNRAVATHKRQAHALFHPTSLRVTTTHCPICLSHLGTRARVLLHLRQRLECSLQLVHLYPSLPVEAFTQQLHSLNSVNTFHTRTHIPRRGRIPTIAGRPRSQATKEVAFDINGIADVEPDLAS